MLSMLDFELLRPEVESLVEDEGLKVRELDEEEDVDEEFGRLEDDDFPVLSEEEEDRFVLLLLDDDL